MSQAAAARGAGKAMGTGRMWFMKFDPSAWLADPAVAACSLEAQGLWARLLFRMFLCPERGVLKTGAEPWGLAEISMECRTDPGTAQRLLNELLRNGVCDRREGDGALINRRIVREQGAREGARARVRRHRGQVRNGAEEGRKEYGGKEIGQGRGLGNGHVTDRGKKLEARGERPEAAGELGSSLPPALRSPTAHAAAGGREGRRPQPAQENCAEGTSRKERGSDETVSFRLIDYLEFEREFLRVTGKHPGRERVKRELYLALCRRWTETVVLDGLRAWAQQRGGVRNFRGDGYYAAMDFLKGEGAAMIEYMLETRAAAERGKARPGCAKCGGTGAVVDGEGEERRARRCACVA